VIFNNIHYSKPITVVYAGICDGIKLQENDLRCKEIDKQSLNVTLFTRESNSVEVVDVFFAQEEHRLSRVS